MPHGSILGSTAAILFYIHDTVRSSDLFDDDTNLFMSNIDLKTLISNVNDELSKVSQWLKVNKLSLNIKRRLIL